ncbi:metal-dependent hydrolase [Nonlabens ponticola]|uniref:Metal-dependent hydrolase n=1 Tax=Nonlabens ponticola TaxID=2496866 RepID=A0A3S9MXM8_9FLAO|nr:metal-dependent hydrolase [Nonlabens ponticola]AZQ43803.1 metal-dependent hydrolase [Nonlabens ponticola]
MDSLTQIVLGAATGEVVLGRKVGNKAMLYGAIAGTIPDLDVLVKNFTDTITATEAHRGLSHSIVFCVLAAPLLGWLVNKIERKANLGWKPWAWLFFWGLFTHPLLDVFTTWGTQLFWPFDLRLAFNSIFVIDPFYTIPFLGCVIWAMFLNRKSAQRRKVNWAGIIWSSCYLLLTLVLKSIVHGKFEKALEDKGYSYSEISTRPAAFNTILWNGNVDARDAYLISDYSFFDTQPIEFERFPKNRAQEPNYEPQQAQINLKRLIDISQGWYLMEQKKNTWFFYDLRFGRIPVSDSEQNFVFAYELDQTNETLIATETEKDFDNVDFILEKLWERIKGN